MKIDSKYIEGWRKRFAEQESESQALARRARSDLDQAIEILKKYGAKRVFIYGSILRPERFHHGSDLDIVVEGIHRQDFMRASADLMMAMDWQIDLKPLEEVDELFRKMILEQGELIYAK